MALAQAEFAFNYSVNRTTGYSPFQIAYGLNPSSVLDLTPISFRGQSKTKAEDLTTDIQAIHQLVEEWIEASNAKYKEAANKHRKKVTFEFDDYIWAVLTKDRYPVEDYHKLSQHKMGPFCEVKCSASKSWKLMRKGQSMKEASGALASNRVSSSSERAGLDNR
uniref:Uncharacterized protein LOC109505190 n=1 Tax=Elaeis guineensis var. tenera TaxID=51953 RepID=A0A6J0PDK9_ELAGV|nr:uncharacterized protein LOC109505190 [Elaeis guineensis]